MRLTEIRDHPVLSTDDAREHGRIATVVIDPSMGRVRSYRLDGSSAVLAVESARVGSDAVMVDDPGACGPPGDDIEQRAIEHDLDVLGSPVLSDRGNLLGSVADLEFDPPSGTIDAVVLDDGSRVPGSDILGVGTYAVVVLDPSPDP